MKTTNEEALNAINDLICQFNCQFDSLEQTSTAEYFKTSLEGLKVAKEAIEKQIPQVFFVEEPLLSDQAADIEIYYCPHCTKEFMRTGNKHVISNRPKYCSNCGQRLYWSNENDK